MTKTDECKHNSAITCRDHSGCAQCGWNPIEASRRKEYIRETTPRRLALRKMRSHGKT